MLFSLYNVCASDTNNEINYIDKLVERARQFEVLFNQGNYIELAQMFSDSEHPDKEKNIVLYFVNTIDAKASRKKEAPDLFENGILSMDDVQDYGITICDKVSGSPFNNNLVFLDFFKKQNNHEKIASYVERGKILNLQTLINFDRNGNPRYCEIDRRVNPSGTVTIAWNDKGKILKKDNVSLLLNLKTDWPSHNGNNTNSSLEQKKLLLKPDLFQQPQLKGDSVLKVFNRLKILSSIQKIEDFQPLFQWPLTKSKEKETVGSICISKNHVRILAMACRTKEGFSGYFLSFNSDGKIMSYIEGVMQDFDQPVETSHQSSLKESYLPIFDFNLRLGKGIEIEFNGEKYPVNYRTFVKHDRLFGRQIEWNDKGEVISDVDLDIPKPWADAPKIQTETE
jgi:hypothetical protein